MTTTDKTARDALIVDNLGLARHMARKFMGTGIELEDLVSIAYIGLIKAADSYDPDKGVRFGSYAGVVIRNEILMAVRSYRTRAPAALSLDAEVPGTHGVTFADLLPASNNADDALDRASTCEAVHQALGMLKPREVKVVSILHGLDGGAPRKQREVAQAMGVSQSIVSRWNRDAGAKLREALADVV
ncbi:MAG: sigma-70 family RNA polymerase sigma factor [Christensenellaceae bacterium]|nr:sigma-70 family RNA polymerase sigma factor [Christensenellaceae bacterium]MEA5070260.1 sigma-70 family RNA polymerase sigma factor [Christensenellaceae bacterium]